MPARIVIVDAEPTVRTVVSLILNRAGYEVSATENIQTALNLCRTWGPALVLTNVYLPGITGHEALRLLKEECPKVPVLMMSGLPDAPVIQRWMTEDGFNIFPKPFTPEQLTAKVREILNGI